MVSKKQQFGLMVSASFASLATSALFAADPMPNSGKMGPHLADSTPSAYCQNASCKGKSACNGHGSEGPGKNDCAGHGWLKAADEAACKAAHGEWKKG